MNLSKHILDYRKKQTGTLLISENITFANDDVMNYVTGASSKNCPGPPYPLIRLCTEGNHLGIRKKVKGFLMKKVQKFSSLKIIGTNIWPGICHLLNLPNGFLNLAKK